MHDLAVGQILEVTAERLAFGGFAVARHEGRVLFVPFAAPGERLRVEVVELEKNFAHARIQEILTPSPQRREPRCPLFGECGGCHFQHLDYSVQLAGKSEFVGDALRRTGGFDWQEPIVVHHADEWGYRSRTQLKVHGRQMGFYRAFTKAVVEVRKCPVLAPALEAALPAVHDALAQLVDSEMPYQVEGACGIDGAIFAPDLPGMRKDLVEHEVLGHRYLVEPESFFQGNRFLTEKLVAGALGDERGELVFDLYAGVGLFSIPLSHRFERVVAVEDERRAATLGRVNVKNNGCRNVSYVRATTEIFLRENKERPDLVVLDPPRAGAKPAIPLLLQLAPRRMVYVSCDPNTLARDLRQLCNGGYELEQVAAYDMFPQTYHVECVARLRRAAPGTA